MEKLKNVVIILMITFITILMINSESFAATMGMSISKTSGYVGDTFTIKISGINGRVNISANSKVTINKSGSQWVDGSLTITGTAKEVGTGTITVTPVDVTTTSAEPEEVTASASRSITITEKKEETKSPTSSNSGTTTTKPTTTTTKPTTTTTKKTTTTTTKKETETKKEEPKQDNFYISKLTLKGVKENGEKVDIALSPEFNKDTYEYTCNIASDIQKIEFEKDAGEFTNSIIIKGGEDLKEGENTITLMLAAEDHQAKTYTIKITKEAQETVETVAQMEEDKQDETKIENNESKAKMVSMPLWIFIIMQIAIIIIEVLIIYFVPWRNLFKIRNKNIDIEE